MSLPNCATLLPPMPLLHQRSSDDPDEEASDRQHKQHLHRKHRDHQQWDCPPPVLLDPWFCDSEQFQIQHAKQKEVPSKKREPFFHAGFPGYSGII